MTDKAERPAINMVVLALTFSVLLTNGISLAQTSGVPAAISPETQRDIHALQSSARVSEYAYKQVRHLCNNIGPRLSGSPQAAAAVQYVAEELRGLGFEVRLEPVTVRHWERGQEDARLVRYPGQIPGAGQKIVVTALGNSVATAAEGVTAPVVVVSSFEEFDHLSPANVKGKIVLFNHSFDEALAQGGRAEQAYDQAVEYRLRGPVLGVKKGAVAVLVRSVGGSGFRLAHTGVTEYEDHEPKIPGGAIATEDADLIAGLSAQGEVELHLRLTPRDLAPEQSYNVIADLKGTKDPQQIIIVSGHLDSWDLGTGALDDASGVGIAMDVLRVIKTVNARPRRTIRFIAWANEENGLAGGRSYAEEHQSELVNHLAAVEIDMGDGRPLGFNVHADPDKLSHLSRILHAVGDPVGGVAEVNESPGADLTAINVGGVPAIAPLQDARHYFDYHHTAADTFDKVRIEELRRNVEAISTFVYVLAQDYGKDNDTTPNK